jgi:hypothetical protein
MPLNDLQINAQRPASDMKSNQGADVFILAMVLSIEVLTLKRKRDTTLH